MLRKIHLSFGTIVVTLLCLNIVIFTVIILKSDDNLAVQYIPDDAYYYLALSRNYSNLGDWTFDSGTSLTSGFHPLFAYILSFAFSSFNFGESSFVVFGILISLTFALVAIALLWFWGFSQKRVLFLMFVALVISNPTFVKNTISVTEWSLTLLFSVLYFYLFFSRYRHPTVNPIDFFALFTIGLLGSFARTDFGILPLSIVISIIVYSVATNTLKTPFLFSISGLLGASTGLFLVFVHNYILTSEILQSSARMKSYWLLGERNYFAIPALLDRILGISGLILLAFMFALAILSKFTHKNEGDSSPNNYAMDFQTKRQLSSEDEFNFSIARMQNSFIISISAFICMFGYSLIYLSNAAIRPWYTSILTVPALMLIYGISENFVVSKYRRLRFFFQITVFILVSINVSKIYPVTSANSPWPHQKLMFDAGNYLQNNNMDCKIGAWNAGIIGYYEGGHIVNIDGLVNNDIYKYAINNDLPAYLLSRNICYIIDFENMFDSEYARQRGGYDDSGFIESLVPQKVFDEGQYLWKYLTLYSIDKENLLD